MDALPVNLKETRRGTRAETTGGRSSGMATSISMRTMVQEAVRQRKAQRSISTLLIAVGIGLVFLLGGLFVSLHWDAWPIGLPFMVAGVVVAIRFGSKYKPRRPWGAVRFERCPKCQQQHLREGQVRYEVPGAVRKTIYRATVVLCDEACGFGVGYLPGQRPDLDAAQAPN
jgi:hypothetical protein